MFEQELQNTIMDLKEKFNTINKNGYIKGCKSKSKGNVGLTFEKLIGKENDEF